jgi:glyoxylase-like metal-dependent hydrolase (beta-lactamase superfamily II)
MAPNPETIKLGATTITVFNLYTIPENLQRLIAVPPGETAPATLHQTAELPVQCILVRAPGRTVLVDAGGYEADYDHSGRVGYRPPPDLLTRLAEIGVAPEDVDDVVITHLHGDHFNGLTTARDGGYRLAFPNATGHVGARDWEAPRVREALANPSSLESRTLGVVNQAGRLNPVDGNRELGSGIAIVAAPGETPGHQILRVEAEGGTLYCVGDLYHHPLEVEHPGWMVPWADREANLASRRALVAAALAENARLVATHIDGVGRLTPTPSGVSWATASP